MIGLTIRHVRAHRAALANVPRLSRHSTALEALDRADTHGGISRARIIRRSGRSRTTRMRATRRWSPHRPRDSAILVLRQIPGALCRAPGVPNCSRSLIARFALSPIRRGFGGWRQSLPAPTPVRSPLAPEAQGGLSHGNGCGTQEVRISRWSALPGLLLNTTALEPVWGSSPGPANRQDFNAVTVLMRTARRLFSGVGVNLGTGRPPMVALAKAAPVNPGAFALGARVVSANNAAFQSTCSRGSGHIARCGVGESGCPRGTKGLHERAGATPIDGAARATMGRCTSQSTAIA